MKTFEPYFLNDEADILNKNLSSISVCMPSRPPTRTFSDIEKKKSSSSFTQKVLIETLFYMERWSKCPILKSQIKTLNIFTWIKTYHSLVTNKLFTLIMTSWRLWRHFLGNKKLVHVLLLYDIFAHYFGMISITIICWWKLSKQTSYWSKTGFCSQLKK